jgi:nucleoside-diphosphate-sugar epimerase
VPRRIVITQPAAVFRGADCVAHLAWAFQPTRNVEYLDSVAIGSTRAVLDAAHDAGVPQLVHMSSIGAYAAGLVAAVDVYRDTDRPRVGFQRRSGDVKSGAEQPVFRSSHGP